MSARPSDLASSHTREELEETLANLRAEQIRWTERGLLTTPEMFREIMSYMSALQLQALVLSTREEDS